jgi:hypothetical protein
MITVFLSPSFSFVPLKSKKRQQALARHGNCPEALPSLQSVLHSKKKNTNNAKDTAKYRNNIYGLGTNEKAVQILDIAIIVFAVGFVLLDVLHKSPN